MLTQYFEQSIERRASDLHLIAGRSAILRIDGELEKASEEIISTVDIEKWAREVLSDEKWQYFQNERDVDFAYQLNGTRFRVNLHFQNSELGVACRVINSSISSFDDLGLSETVRSLTNLHNGLILLTGPTGSGKSTTLAAMIDEINKNRSAHILTIEDPVEYIFQENASIIEQREVGKDTPSFAKSLKYAMRQDPNVIMVGEMRDLETIAAALTAAETGHLVLSTLHTSSAAEAVERIVDVFPPHQQRQILIQLASSLRAVIAQRLLRKIGGGRVAACEIMINNTATANLIRTNKTAQINSVIQTSSKEGMITMDAAITKMLKEKIISDEEARKYSSIKSEV